jgi:hypothetical protein
MSLGVRLRILLGGLMLAAGLPCVALAADAAEAVSIAAAKGPGPVIEPARGAQCVADPAFMRRNHMDLLKHQRNETVHLGVRDARASLKGCIECHASKATGSVAAAKTDFCISCHSYAAVKVDCFECHSSKRQTVGFAPLDHLQSTTPVLARLTAQWRRLTEGGR